MECLDISARGDISVNQKQLICSMSLIRFVNGLVDPLQQFSFARSIYHLAKQIDLPLKFVQLRHSSTHENLPSLKVLVHSTNEAIDWLKFKYWDVVLSTLEDSSTPLTSLTSMESRLNDIHAILNSSPSNHSNWSPAANFEPCAIGLLNNKKSNLYL
ncbi:hypothetical protein E3P91_03297 [Wallemia ichthyophaga]|uniref:Uncharacterized protein n=2 Tax=Wallemia ichthyophaga TaxID=245174 RepID=A0A4T0JH66_WALIC|nr:hypothetical protein E3P91_03297 [Wallemia ichthyophaga]TIB42313.1 hypothetical protein E3P86_00437 [Wallemia ichthyophaga]